MPESADALTLWQTYRPVLTDWSGRVAAAVMVLVVAWLIAGWARRLIRRAGERTRLDLTVVKFLANASRWGVLTVAIIAALGQLGVQTASFTAVLAATGLAIGLALQGTLSNLAAGVILLMFRPFRVGDSVTLAGQAGTVNEVGLFMTEIDTADGRRIVVPNAQISGGVIENASHHPRRRAEVLITVSPDADVNATRWALQRAIQAIPGAVSDPAPDVAITSMTAGGVGWAARVWTTRESLGGVQQLLYQAVKESLDKEKIQAPVQTLLVRNA
jgi:small conductance mechanosensitive channel